MGTQWLGLREKDFWCRRCKISLKFHLQIEVNLDLILTKSEKQKNGLSFSSKPSSTLTHTILKLQILYVTSDRFFGKKKTCLIIFAETVPQEKWYFTFPTNGLNAKCVFRLEKSHLMERNFKWKKNIYLESCDENILEYFQWSARTTSEEFFCETTSCRL